MRPEIQNTIGLLLIMVLSMIIVITIYATYTASHSQQNYTSISDDEEPQQICLQLKLKGIDATDNSQIEAQQQESNAT